MADFSINAFKASSVHSQAVEFIDGMIFRGLDPAVPANREFVRLNKFTEAECSNQVINTIAIATGSISFDKSKCTENSLMRGNVNLAQPALKRKLEMIVGQLPIGDSPRYRFVLIPLVLATCDGNTWNKDLTLLVKTKTRGGDQCYVDMAGRIYASFRKFLDENIFPLAVLCYPSDGALVLDSRNHVKLSYAIVGEKARVKRTIDVAVLSISLLTLPVFPLLGSIIVSTYSAMCAGMELLDCYEHGTLNPIKFPHTIIYWAKVSLCIGYLIIHGVQFFASGLQMLANGATLVCSTANFGLAALDLLILEDRYRNMTLEEQTNLSLSLCFQTRQAPSLENGEQELLNGRIAALCSTFAKFVKGPFNGKAFKSLVIDLTRSSIQCTISALLFLAKKLIENNISVKLSNDFVNIKIGNYQLRFKNILRLTSEQILELGALFDQWMAGVSKQLPSKLIELLGEKIGLNMLA